MKAITNIFLSLLLSFVTFFAPGKAKIEIYGLTTEYKVNPIGLGIEHPRFSWKIRSNVPNTMQLHYRIIMAANEQDLRRDKNILWNSGIVETSQSIHIPYTGQHLKSRQRVYWRVIVETNQGKAKSLPAYFEMGLLSSSDWKADWISAKLPKGGNAGEIPYLRKAFNLEKEIEQARLYASAIGVYEMHINGRRVGKEYLTPYWTSYHQRIQYQVYDITKMLKKGRNAAGMILGNGWARNFRSIRTGRESDNYFDYLAGIAQIEVKYRDGSTAIVSTDGSWKSSSGPLLSSTIYNGEVYDARQEMPGWDMDGFDESEWQQVEVIDHPRDVLVSTYGEPVVEHEELTPIKVFKTPKGEIVADMGQNMVGWIRFSIQGERGDTITLKHAEVLDQDGNFYTDNLRAARQEMQYVLKGGGVETFEPHFSFQGFRYVKIEGVKELPSPTQLTGIVVHSSMPVIGGFECSDSLVNQLQHNILWGQKGNFVDVPTDCPQRDERLGWTGDAQVFASTACFNMYTPAFFTKWMQDLALEQKNDGMVTYTVPNVHGNSGGAAGWADAALIVPWNVYQYYGDTRILENQYRSMKAWVEFMRNEAEDVLWYPKHRQFGDWLSYSSDRSDYPGAYTDKDLICNAFYAHSTMLLSDMADTLGYSEDANDYKQLFEKIKASYIREFITPAGRITSGTQTAYVLSLYFDLVPDELVPIVAQRLADDVNLFGHITTGFLGTNLISHVLSKYGYTQEAYLLLNRKAYPSWLYPVTKGATTIWERWDGIKEDGSFQDPSMNSFNHYAYGAVGDWLYRTVAGLNPASAGYKSIRIAPQPGGGLTYAKAWHESMYGRIESAWRMDGNSLHLQVIIPPNTTAEVFIPSSNGELLKSGKIVMNGVRYENGYCIMHIGSGLYDFETFYAP